MSGRTTTKFLVLNLVILASTVTLFYGYFFFDLSTNDVFHSRNLKVTVLQNRSFFHGAHKPSSKSSVCTPRKNIVFVKTHKCASSTIQNMLMRHAFEQNLTLVLPTAANDNYLSKTIPFSRRLISSAPWAGNGYNIFCHHVLYNHSEVKALMPEDSVYTTILRNPISLFESLYSYSHFEDLYGYDIEKFMNNTYNITKRLYGHLGRNQMLFDLGFPEEDFNNTVKVKQQLAKMSKEFDLILIAEHFDESVILLKDLLCWDWNDVITFKLNSRKESKKQKLSEHAKKRIREWSAADVALYDYFLKEFKFRVKKYGEKRMEEDVKKLKEIRKEWFNFCIEGVYDSVKLSKPRKLWSKDVWGFELKKDLKNKTCDDLTVAELQQTARLRERQLIQSLPYRLQSDNSYQLFASGKGPMPKISSLNIKERAKVLRILRLLYPGYSTYLQWQKKS